MEKNEDFFFTQEPWKKRELVSNYQPKQIFSFIYSLPLQRERIAGTKGNALFMLHDFWSPDSFRLFFPRILGEILGSSGFSFEFLEFATFFSERFTSYSYMVGDTWFGGFLALLVLPVTSKKIFYKMPSWLSLISKSSC